MRYGSFSFVVTLIMAAQIAHANDVIKAPAKVEVKAGRIAKVKVETAGKRVVWVNPQPDLMDLETMADDGKSIIIAVDQSVPNGTLFRIYCYTSIGDVPSPPVVVTIQVHNQKPIPPPPNPDPPVPPKPDPPKPDPPKPSKAWLIIVEETANATTTRARIMGDIVLQTYIRNKGWSVRVTDQNAVDENGKTPADLAPYIDRSKGKSLPQMYLVDQDGRVLIEEALPPSPADILVALKKVGG